MNHDQSTRSAGGTRGLDPKWCLDPEVFELEKERIFLNAWIPIGYANQVANAGDFYRTIIHQCEAVVVRDRENQVRAFQNVCQHRGTQLCVESTGNLKSAFACPYHGWKYDLQGNLIAAPNMLDVEGFDPNQFGLPEFKVAEWNGLLFARTPSDNQSGDSELPVRRLDPIAHRYQLAEYQVVETVHYDVPANWKLFFQNFNECYHCPSVHPQLTPYSDYRDSANDFDAGEVLGGPMKIRDSAESLSVDGKFCGQIASQLPQEEFRNARYYTVFPNLFVSFFPDYAMIHRLTPVSFERTRIECDFLFHPETIQSDSFAPNRAVEFWDLTNRQDWEMCERVQVGLSTPGFKPSPYSNLESLLVAFDEYYLSRMGMGRR